LVAEPSRVRFPHQEIGQMLLDRRIALAIRATRILTGSSMTSSSAAATAPMAIRNGGGPLPAGVRVLPGEVAELQGPQPRVEDDEGRATARHGERVGAEDGEDAADGGGAPKERSGGAPADGAGLLAVGDDTAGAGPDAGDDPDRGDAGLEGGILSQWAQYA